MSDLLELSRFESLAHFSPPQLDQLRDLAGERRFAAGARVVAERDAGTDVYAIAAGRVQIERETPYGRFSLASLRAGDLFGESAFLDRSLRSADVISREATALYALDAGRLAERCEIDRGFELALHWAFWKSLSRKLRQSNALLSRFFSAGGSDRGDVSADPVPSPGEVRVEMESKRRLFKEQRLSNLEINFLASLSREERYEPPQVIFHEGDPGDRLYVVLDGKVRISKTIPGAGEEALAFLERGDYFGEMALIDDERRSADARPHDEGTVVLSIPREAIAGILDIHKPSSIRLLKILCGLVAKRLREIDDKLIGWYVLSGGEPGSLDA